MDQLTLDVYASSARDFAERYEAVQSPVARYFASAFPAGSRVLDVGAGSGRDLARLLADGFEAFGVEPCDELRAQALARHPELAGHLDAAALPAMGEPFGGSFDAILCSAVLMHLPEAELFDAAWALKRALRPHGRLLLSLPLARTDIEVGERDAQGRLFKAYAPAYVQLLLERLGFQQIGRWDSEDALGRAGTRWATLLLELRSGTALRAVDQIECILNRDKKVATYKLALFRALAELALQEPRCAAWLADGRVGVPLRRLAEKWLGYYWPIFASPRLIPQSQSEGADGLPVKFRRVLTEFMSPYAQDGEHGGLAAWQLDLARGRLSPERQRVMEATLRVIAQTIRDGPVQFAGGALATGAVFGFDATQGLVLMDAGLWRELSLLGHWIVDAVVLRWAQLTERFGHRQGIRSGEVLPLLLARAEPQRATGMAREVFLRHGVQQCTWSGRKLGADFAVDHVIPFSLWGSNDLWNLLPADVRINAQKSDRLPAAELLQDSRSRIVHGWQLLRDEAPQAFDRQAAHLLGRCIGGPIAWEDDLFTRLREAVELTALQRGVERWVPSVRGAKEGAAA